MAGSKSRVVIIEFKLEISPSVGSSTARPRLIGAPGRVKEISPKPFSLIRPLLGRSLWWKMSLNFSDSQAREWAVLIELASRNSSLLNGSSKSCFQYMPRTYWCDWRMCWMWHDSICCAETLMRASGLTDAHDLGGNVRKDWAQCLSNFCLVCREMSLLRTLNIIAYFSSGEWCIEDVKKANVKRHFCSILLHSHLTSESCSNI